MKIAIVLVAACLVLLGCQRASPVASVPNNSVLTNGSLDYAETGDYILDTPNPHS